MSVEGRRSPTVGSEMEPKPPDPKSSYAAILQGTSSDKEKDASPLFSGFSGKLAPQKTLFRGRPAVIFSESDIGVLSAPLHLALIGKFPYGRPPIDILRKEFLTIGLKGNTNIGVIDSRHILIRPDREEDHQRLWIKESWQIRNFPMKISKWTPNFDPKADSPILPVWINLPGLPLQFFSEEGIFAIASMIGTPMKLDLATLNLSRPSVVRVCIAIDARDELPDSIYIGTPSEGLWQKLEYEKVPRFCTKCTKLGHIARDCGKEKKQEAPKLVYKIVNKDPSRSKGTPTEDELKEGKDSEAAEIPISNQENSSSKTPEPSLNQELVMSKPQEVISLEVVTENNDDKVVPNTLITPAPVTAPLIQEINIESVILQGWQVANGSSGHRVEKETEQELVYHSEHEISDEETSTKEEIIQELRVFNRRLKQKLAKSAISQVLVQDTVPKQKEAALTSEEVRNNNIRGLGNSDVPIRASPRIVKPNPKYIQ